MFKWYKTITQVLDEEPEVWLSYLKGQQINNIPRLINTKPKYSGFNFQLMKLAYIMVSSWEPFSKSNPNDKNTFFVLAGTKNQMSSLEPVIESLKLKQKNVVAVAPKIFLKGQSDNLHYSNILFSTSDIFKTLTLLTLKGPALYTQMNKLHPNAVRYWFTEFASAYLYLVYFHRKLRELKPEFVIVSNDHNVAYRSLLAMARKLNIKTVYLQHASVSNLFPALTMDYAFLDGENSLDIYRQCEINRLPSNLSLSKTKVILSGQKKKIVRHSKGEVKAIGIAINTLDHLSDVTSIISFLLEANKKVILRPHPGQNINDIDFIEKKYGHHTSFTISNPRYHSINNFLSEIKFLLAGNSSIHLEAALAGVRPIYYEFSETDTPDYYGYAKNGLAIRATSLHEINNIIDSYEVPYDYNKSVRYYSSTYKTRWEGREGDLVSQCLIGLMSNNEIPVKPINLFGNVQ